MATGGIRPRCTGCGETDRPLKQNPLIGGHYCAVCEKTITKPDPKL